MAEKICKECDGYGLIEYPCCQPFVCISCEGTGKVKGGWAMFTFLVLASALSTIWLVDVVYEWTMSSPL